MPEPTITDADLAEIETHYSPIAGAPYTDAEWAARVVALVGMARELQAALIGMVEQFAFWSEVDGGCFWTGGMSALEDAFDALGWPGDLHPAAQLACDVDGCSHRVSCGWPSPDGYRRTCGQHYEGHHQAMFGAVLGDGEG